MSINPKGAVTKGSNQKTVHEVKLLHEPFLFWFFDFNRVKTCTKSQFIPFNQKLTIMVNFWLILASYPTFVPLLFLIKRNKLVFSAAFNFHRLASQLLFPLRVFDINFGWNHCQIRCPCNCNKQG